MSDTGSYSEDLRAMPAHGSGGYLAAPGAGAHCLALDVKDNPEAILLFGTLVPGVIA